MWNNNAFELCLQIVAGEENDLTIFIQSQIENISILYEIFVLFFEWF